MLNLLKVTEDVLKPLYEDLNTPGFIANLHKLYERGQLRAKIKIYLFQRVNLQDY